MAIAVVRIRTRHRITRAVRYLAFTGPSATLVASLVQAPFAYAAPPEEPWPLQRETSVPGHNAARLRLLDDPSGEAARLLPACDTDPERIREQASARLAAPPAA